MGCKGCERVAEFFEISSNADPRFDFTTAIRKALSTKCFQLRGGITIFLGDTEIVSETSGKPPEYLLKYNYEEILDDNHVKPDGSKVLLSSTLKIDLYYNGTGGNELIGSWVTEKAERDFGDLPEESLPTSDSSFRYHGNKMCKNRHSVLKEVKPVELTLLYPFEKLPQKCEIKPEKEAAEPLETIEIELTNFEDKDGNQSREFNRIVIQAVEGKIIDGEPLEIDPSLKAFKVGDGTVKFKYQAPDTLDKEEDNIFIFNSCDICRDDLYPLSKTELNKTIAEQKIKILSNKYETNVNINVHWDIDNENNTELGNYDVNIQGIMEKSKKYSKGGIPHYIPKKMKASYTYQNVFRIKNPRCELEGYEESASGEVPLKYTSKSPLAIHMKIHELKKHYKGIAPKDSEAILGQINGAVPEGLEMMQEMMAKSMPHMREMVEKLSAVMPQGLGGTTRKGLKKGKGMLLDRYEIVISCMSAPKQSRNILRTRCKWDEAAQQVIPINEEDKGPILNGFTIYIHSIMGKNNQMSGSHSWDAKEYSLGTIEINELAKTLEQYSSQKLEPFKPKAEPGEDVKINVQWNLKRV